MNCRVEAFTVAQQLPSMFKLSWRLSGDFNTELTILRSDNPYSDFTPVSPTFSGYLTDVFYDVGVSVVKGPYYKLQLTKDDEITIYPEKGIHVTYPPNLLVMQRYNQLNLYNKLYGTAVFYYQKKTTGSRCTHCYDEVTHKVLTSDCQYCYGTGFVGGFHPPLQLYITITQENVLKEDTVASGAAITDTATATFPGYINIQEGDVVRDAINGLWEVSRMVKAQYLQQAVIFSLVKISKVKAGNPKYNLSLPDKVPLVSYKSKTIPTELRA